MDSPEKPDPAAPLAGDRGLPPEVKALSANDTSRLEALVRRHQDSVRGFLLFLGCPRSLVDDLVQDAFLAVFSARFEDRGEAATGAYLRTVARNLFLKAMRRERLRTAALEYEGAERTWVAFEADDGGEGYLAALRACLETLSGRPREVLGLRYRADLGRAAIAGRLGMSESGVKSVLVRTRKRLRECIERRLG